MSKPAIFTRRLNVFDFCRFWVLSRVNDSDIYYNERYVTRPALWLALRCRRFHAAHLDFNKKDKDGFGLLYGFQENINIILAEVLESAQSLPDWLKTSLFWEARSLLEYEIVFIESALHRAAALKLENIVLYGVSNPFFRETQGVYALKGISIRALTRFPAIWKILATPFVSYCMKRSSTKAGSDRPAVWMEYAKLGVHTNAFWRKYIINGDFESVYYLDRADTPVIPEVTRTIENDRVDWIDSHAPKLLGMSGLGIAQLLKLLGSSLSLPRLSLILKAIAFKHQVWHAAYVSVFLKRRVKMLIQHQDRSWAQSVQANAIEKAGGIMLGYHWSNLSYCMRDWFITSQHVYFVWGKTNYEAIVRKGNSCRHILPSGMWIEESAWTDTIREFAAYSGFKLAIFDSDASYDLWQSPKTLSDFFKAVLDLLEKHENWKALFKLKFVHVSYIRKLPDGQDIADRISALNDERRIFIADLDVSPITAGKSADLAVCYTLNSAGICAQIRGAHAVHWDAVGIRYPLADKGGQKMIFSSLDETVQAVEQFAAGDKSIGDLSPWRSLFDHFSDAKASERIAGFIKDYMCAVTSEPGVSGLVISDRIVERYRERNGIGKELYKNLTFWV